MPKEAGIDLSLWQNCRQNISLSASSLNIGTAAILGIHELVDIMRRKETRYLKSWRNIGDSVLESDYQALTTHYGGAYRFALMGLAYYDEGDPLTALNHCDDIGWNLASNPYSFTWEIHPDGTGTVFDLSPDGLGLEPALAHANRHRRVFKTYQFDNRFKDNFLEGGAFSSFTKFGAEGRFTPFYHYLPEYEPADPCIGCSGSPTVKDLANNPKLPATKSPTMAELFSGTSKCHSAQWSTFELVPRFNYAIDSDATHHTRFQRRWTIKALYGEIHQIEGEKRYMRLNPAKAISTDPSVTDKDAAVETFFRGDLSTCATGGTTGTLPLATISWTYGGRLDLGSVFHYYYDRQKTHQLLPHAQINAQNLEGFAWNSMGFIDLGLDENEKSPSVMEATRASNGGYLGSADTDLVRLEGDTFLSVIELPTFVTEGDLFFHGNFIHTIESIDVGRTDITFSPPLRRGVSFNQKISFHRFYRGNFAGSDPATTHPYHGYDSFGNNGYQAVYKKDNLTFQDPVENPGHALVPDFFATTALPYQLSLTNATLPANNDMSDWNYFGLVTKQFSGHQLSFKDHSADGLETSGWNVGQWVTRSFPGTPYAWTPTQEMAWFQPKDLTLSSPNGFSTSEFETEANPTSHEEDRRSTTKYFADNTDNAWEVDNTLLHGRPAVTWTEVSNGESPIAELTQIQTQRFVYDARGRLSSLINGTFRLENDSWVSPYGSSATHSYNVGGNDSLMDLPTSTTAKSVKISWNPGATSPAGALGVSSEVVESTSHVTYDVLGRPLSSETKDANGQTFGEVTTTQYPTQTKEVTASKYPGAANNFTATTTYKNGRGQELVSLRQRGHTNPDTFATVNEYDSLGRLFRAGFERDTTVGSNMDAYAKTAHAVDGAYSETVFNHRGEAFGQIIMRPPVHPEEEHVAESSRWTRLTQDANGNLVTQYLRQAPGETLSGGNLPGLTGVVIKTTTQDDHGMVAEVRDDRVNQTSSAVWTGTDIPIESDLDTYLPDLTSAPLARATFVYDRWENVKQVTVGKPGGVLQTREFDYDQRNRLRREKHPEMRENGTATISEVTYSQYNIFDQPTSIQQGPSRSSTYVYNPAGDLAQMTTGAITTQYNYRYETSGTSAVRFPNLPILIRHDEGSQVAYVHNYDNMRGWLTSRTLFHEFPHFPGYGYVLNLANQTYTNLSANTNGLEMTYTYDALGRVLEETYPGMVTGETDPTHLEYTYDPDDHMLTAITDKAFALPLTLVEGITYDRMDRLKEATYCQPGISSATHKMMKTPDSLNRIASWQALWEDGSAPKLNETRAYTYDSLGHMSEITRQTALGSNSDPLYRYTYDSLGQLKQAWLKPDASASAEIHSFTYDSHGLGNLIGITRNGTTSNFSLDTGTNQLSEFSYNAFGEQTSDQRGGLTYTLGYNDLGRLATFDADSGTDPTLAYYHYDQGGMRVHTATTDQTGAQQERLYFYDDAGMVLCEWVSEQSNGWQPRWDTTHLYLEGNTAFTYTYDKAGETPVTAGASLPQPEILPNGLLTWSATTAPYELEIQDDRKQPVGHFRGLKTAQFSFGKHLPYGKYNVRMKGQGTTWGDWQAVYFLNPDSGNLAGEYGFDHSGEDTSDFHNHSADIDAIGFSQGAYLDALAMDPGERFVIADPHAFLTNGSDATFSVWLKLPPGDPGSELPPVRRHFMDYNFIALWINDHGTVEFKRKGHPYQAASIPMPLNTWTHLAFVYGNGHAEVYVNGQLALNVTNMLTTLTHGDMTFGSLSTSTGFEGLMDRLRLFNRGLTASEIQEEATP